MVAFLGGLKGYRRRIALSVLLAAAEAGGQVVLPFLIGIALDDYIDRSYRGLVLLASVGIVTMLLAVVRRLHDARLYARIYEKVAADTLERETGLSERTARLNMLREVVDFLEFSMP
ncbi:MAG TPA: ABC transporter six-transmembrane domain-containing protein, partial [Sphingomonas sp.]|nr:ABC transporter six-transmembrane domain-containing protein [Sphingomonas sp.]